MWESPIHLMCKRYHFIYVLAFVGLKTDIREYFRLLQKILLTAEQSLNPMNAIAICGQESILV